MAGWGLESPSSINFMKNNTASNLDLLVAEVQEQGFCVVPDIIPAEKCAAIQVRLTEVSGRWRREKQLRELKTSFVPGLINVDQSVAEYIAAEPVLGDIERLLGSNLRVSFTTLLTNEPGRKRSNWHADWPFNQNNACHIPAPYPDLCMHVTALLMVSPFTEQNGGTLVVPGSHRQSTNPSDPSLGIDPFSAHPDERCVTASAGSMALLDSRTWHCAPANLSSKPRMCVGIRYAPWWLNLEPLDPAGELRQQWVNEPGLTENEQSRIQPEAFAALPDHVKPLYRHWVART